MRQLFTIAAILISSLVYAQTGWEKVTISEDVTISFPANPLKAEPREGLKTFMLKLADSTASCIVVSSDLGVLMGIDEAALSEEMEKEESWEQAKTAFVTTIGTEATLVQDEMITIKDNKAMRLVIDRKNDKGGVNTMTVLIFVKGTVSYNVMFTNRNGKADEKIKQQFFNSIEIK
jgi:hypothetical protein